MISKKRKDFWEHLEKDNTKKTLFVQEKGNQFLIYFEFEDDFPDYLEKVITDFFEEGFEYEFSIIELIGRLFPVVEEKTGRHLSMNILTNPDKKICLLSFSISN